MAFIQMSVPLVFWGQRPPAHEITCICRTEEKKGVATASRTGQVVLWDILRERGTEKIKVRVCTHVHAFVHVRVCLGTEMNRKP